MLTFDEDDAKAMLAHALATEPDVRQEQRMLAAVARGWVAADAIGPYPGTFDDLMHLAFTMVGADAIEALEDIEPGLPWRAWLESFDAHLLESVQDAARRGLGCAKVQDVAAQIDAESQLEDEAFAQLSRLRETRDRLQAQKALTSQLVKLLPCEVSA